MGNADRMSGRQRLRRDQTVQFLRQQLRRWESGSQKAGTGSVGTGCEALDRCLPGRGLARGTLVEWLESGPASGAGILALFTAREALLSGGLLLVVDRARRFYPRVVQQWEIDWQTLLVVRPRNEKDELWALDQALRCREIAAVLAWPERLTPRTFRRLQLAAETSGVLGLLIRPDRALGERSWAGVRWRVTPRPSRAGWRIGVELLRGGRGRQRVELEIDETTGTLQKADSLRVVASLACAATRC